MSEHQKLDKIINLTGSYTEQLSESDMNERTLRFLVEDVCRQKFPELDEMEEQRLFESFRRDSERSGYPITFYVISREIHEYQRTIPRIKMEILK